MGLLLTLILLFLVAGVGTAIRQHGWAQGVRCYGAGLAGLGAGAAQAVGFTGGTNSDAPGGDDPHARSEKDPFKAVVDASEGTVSEDESLTAAKMPGDAKVPGFYTYEEARDLWGHPTNLWHDSHFEEDD